MESELVSDEAGIEACEQLFLEHLATIERSIRFAAWRGSLRDAEAEDFASYVKLKLIEKDYAILRKYERRASFAGFISVVVQRMLLDYRIAQWGKWHASLEAQRLGEQAVTIESMLHRDGNTLDEAMPALLRRWPDLTREAAEAIVQRLPFRIRRHPVVELEKIGDTIAAVTDEPALKAEAQSVARKITAIVRDAIRQLDDRDRAIFRLRFESGMSVADISRTLKTEQKPLYRRLKRALHSLRARLESAGVSAADAEELLARRNMDLDFDFGETPAATRSSTDEDSA